MAQANILGERHSCDAPCGEHKRSIGDCMCDHMNQMKAQDKTSVMMYESEKKIRQKKMVGIEELKLSFPPSHNINYHQNKKK